MRNAESPEPEEIGAFPDASPGIEFAGQNRQEVYGGMKATLIQQECLSVGIKTSRQDHSWIGTN
jgi:hypothetical protein